MVSKIQKMSKFMYYLPSRKRTSIMFGWATFVYFLLVPIFYAVMFYFNGMVNIRNLHVTYEDSNTAHVEMYFYCLRMPWGLGTSAEIEVSSGDEKLKITIPYRKWKHLELFHIDNKLKFKYFRTKRSEKGRNLSNNVLKSHAKINFHIFNKIFSYSYYSTINLFGNIGNNKNQKEKKSDEPFKLLDIYSRVENDEIIVNAKLQPSLPEFLNLVIKNFTFDLVEEHSGKLATFLIDMPDKSCVNTLLILNRENSRNLKKVLNIIDSKDFFLNNSATLLFRFEDDIPVDSDLNNALKMILKTFNAKIPNRHCPKHVATKVIKFLEPRSIIFKFFSDKDKYTDILDFQISVHESLFPFELLAGVLKSLPFKNVPCVGQIDDINVIQGSLSQRSDCNSAYFSINFKLKCTNHRLLFKTVETPNKSIFRFFVNDKSTIVSAFFSCISLFYNFKEPPALISLDKVSDKHFEKNTITVKKESNNNCLKIYTYLIRDPSGHIIKNIFQSAKFVEGPFHFEIVEDFVYTLTPDIVFKVKKTEFSIDFARPIINALSVKNEAHFEAFLTYDTNFLNFLLLMEERFNTINKNEPTINIEKMIQNIKFKILKMFYLYKYALEIFIQGDKLDKPLLDWEIETDELVEVNVDLMKCDNSEVVIKFQRNENVDFMAQCSLVFDKPKFHFQMNETEFSIFPDSKKNIVELQIAFSKVLFYPFKVDFKRVCKNKTYSSLIGNVLKRYGFVYDRKKTNIYKQRNDYLPVSNISPNKFKFLSDVSYELDSKKKTAFICGKVLCYYNINSSILQKRCDEFRNKKDGISFHEDDKKCTSNKSSNFPIQIKPLEFRYYDSFVKINEIELIPVSSKSFEKQSEVVININFKIDTKRILEKKSEIKCRYGDEEFLIYYNEGNIKKFIRLFSKNPDRKFYDVIENISHVNIEKIDYNLLRDFRQHTFKFDYRGERMIYFKKITRLIRRLNLKQYPSFFSFESNFRFKFDEFEVRISAESDFPTFYDDSDILKLNVKMVLWCTQEIPFEINSQNFGFICDLSRTRFYGKLLTFVGKIILNFKIGINICLAGGDMAYRGLRSVKHKLFGKSLRRPVPKIKYEGFNNFGLQLYYNSPDLHSNKQLWFHIPKLMDEQDVDGYEQISNFRKGISIGTDFLLGRTGYFTLILCLKGKPYLQHIFFVNFSGTNRWWVFKNIVLKF